MSFAEGVYTVNENLEVWTDLPADPGGTVTSDPLFFVGDPLFPAIGDQHPENTGLRFQNIGQATQLEKDKSKWMFPLIYSSEQVAVADQGGDANYRENEYYDSIIARKNWSFKSIKIPRRASVVSDDGGSNYTTNPQQTATTAGEPVNSTETKYLPVLNYTRNELVIPPDILEFVGSVNSDAITVDGLAVAPDAALVSDIKISQWKRDQATQYRTVSYTFILKDDLWDLDMLNRGFYIRTYDPGSIVFPLSDPSSTLSIAQKPAGPELKLANVTTPQLLKYTAGTVGSGVGNSPVNDAEVFFSSTTELLPIDGTTDLSDAHFRKYAHPQRTVFSGYAFR